MRLHVGTVNGLYELTGAPGSPAPMARAFEGSSVTALASRRRGDGSWLALVDQRALWQSEDLDWTLITTLDAGATCLAAADGDVLIGTTGAHVLRLRGGGVEPVGSFDHVEGRDSWYTPWGAPADARSITAAGPDALYINVHVGGIVRSLDGGRVWEPTIDIHTDVHQVLAPAGLGTVLAASAVGLAVSDDAGGHWRIDTDGLHATYLRAVAVCGDDILVSAAAGHTGASAAVYRRPLGGGSFERCRAGLPEWFSGNIDTGCLDATPDRVALGTPDGSVFTSVDGGRSWTEVASGLPRVTSVGIAG